MKVPVAGEESITSEGETPLEGITGSAVKEGNAVFGWTITVVIIVIGIAGYFLFRKKE